VHLAIVARLQHPHILALIDSGDAQAAVVMAAGSIALAVIAIVVVLMR